MNTMKELKEFGRTFKMIKYRVLGYESCIQPEYLSKVGDVYKETAGGWFLNIRTECTTNIMNIENSEEFYEEVFE